jgi:hypothetical protein
MTDRDELAASADAAGDRAVELAAAGEYDAALDNLASRLGEVGRHVEALAAARESVALFKDLARLGDAAADSESAMFVPSDAAAMSNLSLPHHENEDDGAA